MTDSSSTSSTASCTSFSSFDEVSVKPAAGDTLKLLCSYGGKILPRYPDGKLRYVGGDTRVLAVDRSAPFAELQMKLEELCGLGSVSVRCQLPTEDLDDALVSVTTDEDLAYLVEEYDLASRERLVPLKIRCFLSAVSTKTKRNSAELAGREVSAAAAVLGGVDERSRRTSRFSGARHGEDQRACCGARRSPRAQQHMVHRGNYWQRTGGC